MNQQPHGNPYLPASTSEPNDSRINLAQKCSHDQPSSSGATLVECLSRRYGHFLSRAQRFCRRDPTAAEDVLQEALLDVLKMGERFRGCNDCKAWFTRVLQRTAAKRWKKVWLLTEATAVRVEDCYLTTSPSDPQDQSLQTLLGQSALQMLTAKQREVLFARVILDLKIREIAEVCGLSVGTISSHLGDIKQRLCKKLRKEEFMN